MNMPHAFALRFAPFVLGTICVLGCASPATADDVADLPVIHQDDFEQGADHWRATDAGAWKIVDGPHGKAYALVRQSEYQPPHRSPLNYALLKDKPVGDFVLDVQVQSTTRDYGHRDLCLVFGYQDAAHFYYVHFGKETDDHANQIFIVNGAPRTKISTRTSNGAPWDDGWHHLRIERNAASGAIAVYFDDMSEPAMTADDATFPAGLVGVGSFDDEGVFDQFSLRGQAAP